ncbi:hypothetical protein LCGC14_1923750 [marine sediment metagenome]|uniref:Uncharacterized protein n=1 Tax=marine sediment metagenome TaxID=412755 RepID=A0A0F9FQN9_9ZZZZ
MTDADLDRIMTFHWPLVLRRVMAEGDDWAKGFTKSIARNAKRPEWRPTVKQAAIMRRFVAEVGHQSEDIELIER